MKKLFAFVFVAAATVSLHAQSVNRDLLHRPLGESWPTYSGDYTGRRFSALKQIDRTNVKTLTLAWTRRLTAGPGPSGPPLPGEAPVVTGGEGDVVFGGATVVKGSILAIEGVLYVTAPDNVWALDANDGHLLWRYFW
jgi:alcohol dehydrogenase (cytochrome c)